MTQKELLIEQLIKESKVDLKQAITLLEKEFVYLSSYPQPVYIQPTINPFRWETISVNGSSTTYLNYKVEQ